MMNYFPFLVRRLIKPPLLLCIVLLTGSAAAQQNSAPTPKEAANNEVAQNAEAAVLGENPLSGHTRSVYSGIKNLILRAAEKMPEEQYNYKPAEEVRTFGQLVGHIADANYGFCAIAQGVKNPQPQIEKTKTTKAELIAGLKEAFAYCDSAYDSTTDATASQPVKLMGKDKPRIGALNVNNVHTMLHYGNLRTYLRMKGIVPPSTEMGMGAPQPQKK